MAGRQAEAHTSALRAAWAFLLLFCTTCSVASAQAQTAGSQYDGGGWAAGTEVRPTPAPSAGTRAASQAGRAPAPAPGDAGRRRGKDRSQAAASNEVLAAELTGGTTRTTLVLALGGPIEAVARSLTSPPRVIVDLPETAFRLPAGTGERGHGLVSGFRFGLIEAGRSRVVLDTGVAVRVARSEVVLDDAHGAFRLELDLEPATAAEIAAIELAEAASTLRPGAAETPDQPRAGKSGRPVVVIDAGHGGIDPGASGSRVLEKDLVLSVSKEVERSLVATGRYEVVMTRRGDVFVALDERVAIARRHGADLFISLHADSLPARDAHRNVRGATVYTLSDEASDDIARRMADKENAVDMLAGLPATASGDDQVRDILLDLMRRETHGYAAEFRRTLVGALGAAAALSRDPNRSGPFRVLRQASTPSVLIELGYISNPEDEAIMSRPTWQARVAAAIARAIDGHFRQRDTARR